jgi:hypothetical protein
MSGASGPNLPMKFLGVSTAVLASATGLVVLAIAFLFGFVLWKTGQDWPDHLPAEEAAFRSLVSDRLANGDGPDAIAASLAEIGISDCRYVAQDPALATPPGQLMLRCTRTASRTLFSGTIGTVTATLGDGRAVRIEARVDTVWP